MIQTLKLTDLAARLDVAELSVGRLEVGPLGAGDLARLFVKYPAIHAFLSGRIDQSAILSLSADAPNAIPEIIAISCGMPGASGIAAARRISAGDQLIAIDKILAITFPGGTESFFALLDEFAPDPPPTELVRSHPDESPEIDALMGKSLD